MVSDATERQAGTVILANAGGPVMPLVSQAAHIHRVRNIL